MAEAIDYKHIGSRPVRPDGVELLMLSLYLGFMQ